MSDQGRRYAPGVSGPRESRRLRRGWDDEAIAEPVLLDLVLEDAFHAEMERRRRVSSMDRPDSTRARRSDWVDEDLVRSRPAR